MGTAHPGQGHGFDATPAQMCQIGEATKRACSAAPSVSFSRRVPCQFRAGCSSCDRHDLRRTDCRTPRPAMGRTRPHGFNNRVDIASRSILVALRHDTRSPGRSIPFRA